MKQFLIKYVFLFLALCMTVCALGQTKTWREMYKVKKKDTIFGIAKRYGLTVDELTKANPEMGMSGYQLKKGDYIFIPYASTNASTGKGNTPSDKAVDPIAHKAIKVGVMLPLHNIDGDGRRMVEYYRGILMACDSLKRLGISTDIHAWNVNIDADIRATLLDEAAGQCDIIFGPLYTKQVKPLADFCKSKGIKLVIPFSINGNDVSTHENIFQIYQTADDINASTIKSFLQRFHEAHPVFVDANDSTTHKGTFTFGLRKELERQGITYHITNLKSSDDYFLKAFDATKLNVVVINTGRSPELNSLLAKLDVMKKRAPHIRVCLFGYTEWLMYTKVYNDYFFKYNAYIPTTFYYNAVSPSTKYFETRYQQDFHTQMQGALPRFAITGFDQAQYFLRGLHQYGSTFTGSKGQSDYKPLQTPLKFTRVGQGGMKNNYFMLVHYTADHSIESISY